MLQQMCPDLGALQVFFIIILACGFICIDVIYMQSGLLFWMLISDSVEIFSIFYLIFKMKESFWFLWAKQKDLLSAESLLRFLWPCYFSLFVLPPVRS